MRPIVPAALAALLAAAPAAAAPSEDWSARIAADGLAGAEAALSALPAPTPDDLFALGAVHFLRGVEQAMQLRWKMGATGEIAPVPLLRLALPANPAPEPFRASLVAEVFQGILAEMDQSGTALARIGDAGEVGLTVRLEDLWLDIDGNGTRGTGEGLVAFALASLMNPWDEPPPPGTAPSVRFDTADAAWLLAYTHLVSAVSEFALAYDPTAATERVLAAAADKRARLGPMPSTLEQVTGPGAPLDKAMIALLALRQQPDPARTRAAKADLLAMIAANRDFWARVARETDNEAEWLPNGSQTSAFGITLPAETGDTWMAVLAELQAMLEGKLLVPHWALPAGSGVDVGAFLDNPAPLEVLGWIHGIDALPHARQGATISGQAWNAFESTIGGNGVFFALYLN